MINCCPNLRKSNSQLGCDMLALLVNQQQVSGAPTPQWQVDANKQSNKTKQYGHGFWYIT